MNRIYIASAFTERFWCRAIKALLLEKKWTVTSTWHDLQDEDGNLEHWATECQNGVLSADVVLLFVAGQSQGGRWVEMGMALASHIPVIVVGQTNNLFKHHADAICCHESEWWQTLTAYLNGK